MRTPPRQRRGVLVPTTTGHGRTPKEREPSRDWWMSLLCVFCCFALGGWLFLPSSSRLPHPPPLMRRRRRSLERGLEDAGHDAGSVEGAGLVDAAIDAQLVANPVGGAETDRVAEAGGEVGGPVEQVAVGGGLDEGVLDRNRGVTNPLAGGGDGVGDSFGRVNGPIDARRHGIDHRVPPAAAVLEQRQERVRGAADVAADNLAAAGAQVAADRGRLAPRRRFPCRR